MPSSTTRGPCGPLTMRIRRYRPSSRELVEARLDVASSAAPQADGVPAAASRASGSARRRGAAGPCLLAREAQLRRRVPEPDLDAGRRRRSAASSRKSSTTSGVSPSSQPRAVVGPRVGAVVGLARDVQAEVARTSRGPRSGVLPSVVRKLPIITPLRPALTASGCSSPRFSTRPPQSRNSALGQDQAEDRDPLHGLPRVHVARGRRTSCPGAG